MGSLQKDKALVRYYGDTILVGGGAAERICELMGELDATRNKVLITTTQDGGQPGRFVCYWELLSRFLPIPGPDQKRKRISEPGNFHVLPKSYRFPDSERGLKGDEHISEARYRGVILGDEADKLKHMASTRGIHLEVKGGMPIDRVSAQEAFDKVHNRLKQFERRLMQSYATLLAEETPLDQKFTAVKEIDDIGCFLDSKENPLAPVERGLRETLPRNFRKEYRDGYRFSVGVEEPPLDPSNLEAYQKARDSLLSQIEIAKLSGAFKCTKRAQQDAEKTKKK